VAIDDDLRTVLELDLDHAAGFGLEIKIGDAAHRSRLQRRFDARQLGVCRHHEFPFVHRALPSKLCKTADRIPNVAGSARRIYLRLQFPAR
jgi:hypothetical protein